MKPFSQCRTFFLKLSRIIESLKCDQIPASRDLSKQEVFFRKNIQDLFFFHLFKGIQSSDYSAAMETRELTDNDVTTCFQTPAGCSSLGKVK